MNDEPREYRKKPVVIEAMRWDGSYEAQARIVNWASGHVSGWFDDRYFLEVHTLEGVMRVDPGDYVIRGIKGEFYPCKPDIFEATYDPVSAVSP